ncbi:c-type cytochrome [Methylacidimicrobium tartarophylax]|uniref:Nitric oxide reductase subunit C n=1 Tax=Methylacidimicrobium tartarophylax TaxID=1041768 RepID=A0A5E6M8D4_9BACT|nr:c-type cytochrome [Methylacidimicrobium tartarophylax]VVM05497.1 nitric oxide reductase subunit C [Methylacidimicrobium tartarophylax]
MIEDPRFWRSGAISASTVMIAVLVILSSDTLRTIRAGGRNVPEYTVINQRIGYAMDAAANRYRPVLGGEELLFGRRYSAQEAAKLIERGKLVIQTRACLDCHTMFGIGAYYAPDLTKSWLDPIWPSWQAMTQASSREEAMVRFLQNPDRYPIGVRIMPNLRIDRADAEALVAYLKWLSSIETNGFPARFGD